MALVCRNARGTRVQTERPEKERKRDESGARVGEIETERDERGERARKLASQGQFVHKR